jgi:hypothetical protein
MKRTIPGGPGGREELRRNLNKLFEKIQEDGGVTAELSYAITPEPDKDIDRILADARDYYRKKAFLLWHLAGGTGA